MHRTKLILMGDSGHILALLLSLMTLFASANVKAQISNERSAEEHYAAAVQEFEKHSYTKSLKKFKECDLLRIKAPGYVGITSNTNHWIAYILHLQGKNSEAADRDVYCYQIPPIDLRECEFALALDQKANAFMAQKDYINALNQYRLCLIEDQNLFGHNHYFVGNDYLNMADVASHIATEQDNVIPYFEKGLQIYEGYGLQSVNMCQFIKLQMAANRLALSQISQAEHYLPNKDELIPEHIPQWYFLKIVLANMKADNDEVISLGNGYRKTPESKRDSLYYSSITELNINALANKQDLNEAIKLSYKLYHYYKSKYPVEDPHYLKAIISLGSLLERANRNIEALALYTSVFDEDNISPYDILSDLSKDIEHPTLPFYVDLVAQLFSIASTLGLSEELTELYEPINDYLTAIDWQTYLGGPNFNSLLKLYEISHNLLANDYLTNGNFDAALNIYEEMLSLQAIKEYGNYYNLLNNCGILYCLIGNYTKAAEYFEEVLKNLPDDNGVVSANLMVAYGMENPLHPRVAELDSISFSRYKNDVYSSLLLKSQFERELMWESRMFHINSGFSMMSNVCKGLNEAVNGIAYNSLLLGRGFLLYSQSEVQKLLNSISDHSVLSLKEDVYSLEKRMTSMDPSSIQYAQCMVEKTRLEAIIFEQLSQNSELLSKINFTVDDVKKHLNDNSVAVEFTYSRSGISDSTYSYYAFFVKKDWDFPSYVQLDIPSDLENVDDLYVNPEYTSRIWREVIENAHLSAGDTIYFAADRMLHSIGIENLQYDITGIPICKVYNIFRMSSTRELCIPENSLPDSARSITLWGGLDYGNAEVAVGTKKRNRGSTQGLCPLPETKAEIEQISEMLRRQKCHFDIRCFSANNGTEDKFYSIDGKSPSIIHFATHGDYMDNDTEYPMNNSMLYLSGSEDAYYGISTAPHESDGILTAEEISNMNLSSTDLVVMSACNTALGRISFDGVFGLQRGFKQAGVKSILMSLWRVDDVATRKLMTEFYNNWIIKKMTKHDALETAKNTVREIKGWEDPKYWAAFILLD